MTDTSEIHDDADGVSGSGLRGAEVELGESHRPRFWLRMLVGVALVIGMAVGYFAMGYQKAARQAEAIDAIVRAGGRVYLDYQWSQDEPVTDAKRPQAAWVRRLIGDTLLDRAVAVDLRGVERPDDIARLLLLLPYVCDIRAGDTLLSDESLAAWRGKRGLTGLDLQGTRVTDAGIEHLSHLSGLATLSLARTAVSDKSVAALERCRRLEKLDLSDTRVSASAIQRLRDRLPKCRIKATASRAARSAIIRHLTGSATLRTPVAASGETGCTSARS